MTFRHNIFLMVSALTALSIGVFFYFAIQVDWTFQESEFGCGVIESPESMISNSTDSTFLAGQKVFRTYCASCHKVDKAMTGPMLGGIRAKYTDDMDWLYKWIRNAPAMVQVGDPKP